MPLMLLVWKVLGVEQRLVDGLVWRKGKGIAKTAHSRMQHSYARRSKRFPETQTLGQYVVKNRKLAVKKVQ